MFLSNCVQLIRDHADVKQRHHVDNPTDYTTRGLDIPERKNSKMVSRTAIPLKK